MESAALMTRSRTPLIAVMDDGEYVGRDHRLPAPQPVALSWPTL